MKAFSFFILMLFLSFSYWMIQSPSSLDQKDVFHLENELKRNIFNLLDKKSYTDIYFHSVSSKILKKDSIQVDFSYEFKDENKNKIFLKGKLILERKLSLSSKQKWKVSDLSIDQNYIRFFKGLEIEI